MRTFLASLLLTAAAVVYLLLLPVTESPRASGSAGFAVAPVSELPNQFAMGDLETGDRFELAPDRVPASHSAAPASNLLQGFVRDQDGVPVPDAEVILIREQDTTMEAAKVIGGRMTDTSGNSLSGVTIQAFSFDQRNQQTLASVESDGDGDFLFEDLHAGSYTLLVKARDTSLGVSGK